MSAAEPTVALVFSPEHWVEDLHRHLAHHGGARVRQIVVEPAIAIDEDYDALVVSDRWPALTRGFVAAVHERGRQVLGVFDPDEPAGKDHLLALGVDATIAADSANTEFVSALRSLAVRSPEQAGFARVPADGASPDRDRGSLVVVSGPRGGGITEIALGLAGELAARREPAVLVDAHTAAPSVAGRLGLGLEPNLRSAVDAHVHGMGALDDAVVPLGTATAGSLGVVSGFPSAVAAAQVTTRDVLEVVDALRGEHRRIVVDADDASPTASALFGECSAVVGVIAASPVGVVRALDWVVTARGAASSVPLHLVVNRAPASRFRQEEIRREIVRTVAPTSITWVPADRRVDAASWNGELVARGPFRAAVAQLAVAVAPVEWRRRWWSR
jgi:MinD-like ATPase involved in chromosome partitioning or flagellar assembly